MVTSLILAIRHYRSTRRVTGDDTPSATTETSFDDGAARWQHKLAWVLFNMAASLALAVTLGYWITDYNPSHVISADNLIKHGINAVVIIVDVVVVATPVRLLHIWQPAVFLTYYAIFTVVYWASGGTNEAGAPYIYSTINYTDAPGSAVVYLLFGFLTSLPFTHVIVFVVYKLRVLLLTSRRSRAPAQEATAAPLADIKDSPERPQIP
ncbi:PREDICTED: protein rolling stone-like [Priapulus caudatus]|uniref:Protein rolling stone-like n=1 Tax=Priapulus caudatus TaxID=37621 RepID=A0ABM1F977_PRICU|nr:PREDICTED: protein rolling stone-like [Priapulus caudatus]